MLYRDSVYLGVVRLGANYLVAGGPASPDLVLSVSPDEIEPLWRAIGIEHRYEMPSPLTVGVTPNLNVSCDPYMYSAEWFDTFVARRAPAADGAELDAIMAHIPRATYPRVIDIGCGTGRMAGPLAMRGYTVTGIDASPIVLTMAKDRASGPQYVALDQRHVGRMRWAFDAVLVLWNSLGFVDRDTDLETVLGMTAILRRGGKVLFDMYHPDWMRDHELPGEPDPVHGVAVRRWVSERRCFHEIRYPSGQCDDIQFELYQPDELTDLARSAGLVPDRAMTWWDMSRSPSRQIARYQMVCTRSS